MTTVTSNNQEGAMNQQTANVFEGVMYPTKAAMMQAMLTTYYGNMTTRELVYLLCDEWPRAFAESEADEIIRQLKLDQPAISLDGQEQPSHMARVGYDRRYLVAALTAFWQDVALGIDPRFDVAW